MRHVIERLHGLEEKFKSIEVHLTLNLDSIDICLVSGLVIPQNFKIPNFDKYKWLSYPHTHLREYYHNMVTHIYNDKLLIHYFPNNLIAHL